MVWANYLLQCLIEINFVILSAHNKEQSKYSDPNFAYLTMLQITRPHKRRLYVVFGMDFSNETSALTFGVENHKL
jgi:hypothetical protein